MLFLIAIVFSLALKNSDCVTFLQAYGEDVGLEPLDASWLLSVIGIANTIGRLVLGYIADKPWVNRLLVYNLSLTIAGIGECSLTSQSFHQSLFMFPFEEYKFFFFSCPLQQQFWW